MLEAMKTVGWQPMMEAATPPLRENKAFLLEVIETKGGAEVLRYVAEHLTRDQYFMGRIATSDERCLDFWTGGEGTWNPPPWIRL